MKISRSDQTCALGAAIFGAVTAGKKNSGYNTVEEAQQKMTGVKETFKPDKENHKVYQELFRLYKELHDAFGTREWTGKLDFVMKDLIALREKQRRSE